MPRCYEFTRHSLSATRWGRPLIHGWADHDLWTIRFHFQARRRAGLWLRLRLRLVNNGAFTAHRPLYAWFLGFIFLVTVLLLLLRLRCIDSIALGAR